MNHLVHRRILPKFIKTYSEMVHSATSMAPSKVIDSDILPIWNRKIAGLSVVKRESSEVLVGQHVRIA